MMNTPFKSKDKEKIERMTLGHFKILGILLTSGEPLIQTIIWLNENFEDIYSRANTEVEAYEQILDEFSINYTINKNNDQD